MVKGWFVGNISPVAFKTTACEVAFKRYKPEDYTNIIITRLLPKLH